MREFFEILASLVRPFFGSIRSIFTGELGWRPIAAVAMQAVLQYLIVSSLLSVGVGCAAAITALLVLVGIACMFVVGAAALGEAFNPRCGDAPSFFFALTISAVVATFLTLIVLGMSAIFVGFGVLGLIFPSMPVTAFGSAFWTMSAIRNLDARDRRSEEQTR